MSAAVVPDSLSLQPGDLPYKSTKPPFGASDCGRKGQVVSVKAKC